MQDDDDGLTIPPLGPGGSNLHRAFWTWLAFLHNGLTDAADVARRNFLYEVQKSRSIDEPLWGRVIAEQRIARAVDAARAEFADDLRRERAWLAYKAGRRTIPRPVVGKSYDWRSRRRLLIPPVMTCPEYEPFRLTTRDARIIVKPRRPKKGRGVAG